MRSASTPAWLHKPFYVDLRPFRLSWTLSGGAALGKRLHEAPRDVCSEPSHWEDG